MVPTFRRRGRPAVPFRSVSAALVLAAFASAAAAQDIRLFPGVPEPPVVNARSVVVLEAARGRILYERDADIPIPPASLTKLMTLRVLYKEFASGRMSPDDLVTVLPEDCALPYNSSLMYLQPYMKLPVRVLMQGLAVVSGNDAARALARAAAGSIEAFAGRMNEEAAALGLETTRFVEPSGLSEYNLTTAREMALFAFRYLKDNPESL
ncbi:MAG TPA: serine hydrolase, partial [Spirochaetia bacterium]|nr:serine hydrolase [Spirochaetia bacterium]